MIPVLRVMFLRWVITVFMEMLRRSAISLLRYPRATSARTSFSRSLSTSPSLSPEASAAAYASQAPSPSPLITEEGSPSPTGSEEAGGAAEADAIPGFMEGSIVDPEDVPELMAQLADHDDYKDMTVQSVTYKLYEGRQAYYVVLQGEGEATHPIYVFADGSVTDDVDGSTED